MLDILANVFVAVDMSTLQYLLLYYLFLQEFENNKFCLCSQKQFSLFFAVGLIFLIGALYTWNQNVQILKITGHHSYHNGLLDNCYHVYLDVGSNVGIQGRSHCRASGGMAIFLGVSAAPERILLSKNSYAPVQHSSLHQKVLL